MAIVSVQQARQNFAELMEFAYYKNEQFQIQRNRKAMAWLVGDPFMRSMEKILNYLNKHQPSLADTLAIMADEELMTAIEQGTEEVKKGKTIPIEDAL